MPAPSVVTRTSQKRCPQPPRSQRASPSARPAAPAAADSPLPSARMSGATSVILLLGETGAGGYLDRRRRVKRALFLPSPPLLTPAARGEKTHTPRSPAGS